MMITPFFIAITMAAVSIGCFASVRFCWLSPVRSDRAFIIVLAPMAIVALLAGCSLMILAFS